MNGFLEIMDWKMLFFVIHIILSVVSVFLLIGKFNSHKLAETLIIVLMPFLGLILIIAMRIANFRFKQLGMERKVREHLEELLKQEEEQFTVSEDVLLGGDIVPLNDMLYLEKVGDKHALLTAAVRQSVLEDMSILKKAIRDEDREVSHYASSMATSAISTLEKKLYSFKDGKAENWENAEFLKGYEETIAGYLKLGLVDKVTYARIVEQHKEVLVQLQKLLPENEVYLDKLLDILLKQKNYQEAEVFAKQAVVDNPESEKHYLLLLRVYTSCKEYDKMRDVLGRLKSSNIKLSAEGMKTIRYWMG